MSPRPRGDRQPLPRSRSGRGLCLVALLVGASSLLIVVSGGVGAAIPARPSGAPAPGAPAGDITGADLAAVQFLNARIGVAVTLSSVRLARSADGGRSWRPSGTALSVSARSRVIAAQLAFSSATTGWLRAGTTLSFTSDGGRSWRLSNSPGESTCALVAAGATIGALVGNPTKRTLAIWRLSSTGAVLQRVELPVASIQRVNPNELGNDVLAVRPADGELAVVLPPANGPLPSKLLVQAAGGAQLVRRAAPCSSVVGLDAFGPSTLVAFCAAGAAMYQQPKSVVLSRDDGRHWHTAASWPNIQAPDPSGLPTGTFEAAAFDPTGRLFFAGEADVAWSGDIGRSWHGGEVTRAGGACVPAHADVGAEFSFPSASQGWLLLKHEVLLHTTDGTHWSVVSPRVCP